MVRTANIDTPAERLASIARLPRGIALLADFLGSLKRPGDDYSELADRLRRTVIEPGYGDPDLFFRLIRKNLARSESGLDTDFSGLSEISSNLAPEMFALAGEGETGAAIESFEQTVDILSALPDEALVSLAAEKIAFDRRTFADFRDRPNYLYAKINHAYWEHLVNLYFDRTGRRYYRFVHPVVATRSYETSGFNALFFAVAQKHFRDPGAGTFADAHLGLAFDAGDIPNPVFSYPLAPPIRGAMLGSLSFLEASHRVLSEGGRANLAVGSTPKSMLVQNTLAEFVSWTAERSELVMFIVPPHLRDVALSETSAGPTAAFVIPGTYVHELWIPVLASAAAAFEEAFSKFAAVTIFVQAAVMSYPLMLLAKHIQGRHAPGCALKYFDLGQVLDIATLQSGRPAGSPWVRKRAELLARVQSPFTITDRE